MRAFLRKDMARIPSIASLARASVKLLCAGTLLAGCGGAAANYEANPNGGGSPGGGSAGGGNKGHDLKLPDAEPEHSFMQVGPVSAMHTEASVAAPPPPLEEKKIDARKSFVDKSSSRDGKDSAAGEAAASAAASAGPPPPPGGGGAGGGAGAVHAAVVDSEGGLSEADVRATIVQKQGSFRECYEMGTKASSGFAGTVSLRVSIGPTGTVASVEVTASTTKLAQVDSCVADAVKRIQFPAKGGGAVVGFPIAFGN